MSTEPVPASRTLRIDALHGPTGQILHARVLHFAAFPRKGSPGGLMNFNGAHCAAARLWCQEKTPQDMGVQLRSYRAGRKMADQTKERATCKAQLAHGGIHGQRGIQFRRRETCHAKSW